jgi:autoinducer 2-degrading protein
MLHMVHVSVHVKPDHIDDFKTATLDNARSSVQEPGIARFDVVQQADDPTRFMLLEVYRSAEAAAAHKETAHYARWRDAVADMMQESRSSAKFTNVFPPDCQW